MKNYSLLLLLSLLIIGCSKDGDEFFQQTQNNYSIRIESFTDKDKAIESAYNIKESLNQNISIQIDSSKGIPDYNIMVGSFSSSFEAGKAAYKLFGAKKRKYIISYKSKIVEDNFKSFLYIDHSKGIPSVYKINLSIGKPQLIWNKSEDRIVKLNIAEEGTAFLITSSRFGRKELFPFIDNLKLYRFNPTDNKTDMAYEFGSGIQAYSYWEDPYNFKIIFNRFRDKSTNFVVEHSVICNLNGNIISDQQKIYDIIKENYPSPPDEAFNLISPDNKYKIVNSSGLHEDISYYVSGSGKNKMILQTVRSLTGINWSNGSSYIALNTAKDNSSLSDSLLIFNINRNEIIYKYQGSGIENISWRGNIIFFTCHTVKGKRIVAYDVNRKITLYDQIVRNP